MIARRGLLALLGGLPFMSMPQRPDQVYDPPLSGLAPSSQTGIFRKISIGSTVILSPSGDTTGTLDQSNIQHQLNNGFSVQMAAGQWYLNSTIIINFDGAALTGAGRSTKITILAGFTGAQVIWVQGPGGTTPRYGPLLQDFVIQNNNNNGLVGIQLDSTYFAAISRVGVEGVYAKDIFLNGTPSIFGAYTRIDSCHIGPTPGGPTSAGTGIVSSNHEWWTVEKTLVNWFNQSGGIGIDVANDAVEIIGCNFDECQVSIRCNFSNATGVIGCNFDRGWLAFINLVGSKQGRIIGNDFETFAGAGSQYMVNASNTRNANLVAFNHAKPSSGWFGFVTENATPATVADVYQQNDDVGLAANNALSNGIWLTWPTVWTDITSGFPAGVTGRISYRTSITNDIELDFALTVTGAPSIGGGTFFATVSPAPAATKMYTVQAQIGGNWQPLSFDVDTGGNIHARNAGITTITTLTGSASLPLGTV